MTTSTFRNLSPANGSPARRRHAQPQSVDLADVIGEYAQADAAQARAAIAAAKQAFPGWANGSIQERANILDRAGNEILARKDELGRLLSREEGKTLPEGVGEATRAGNIFKFFAGEVLRLAGEKLPSVRPGRRRRGHARAARRRRPHHAVELPDRDSRRGRSRRRWRTATPSCSSRPTSCPDARGRSPRSWRSAGIPAGVFNLVMGRGSVVGEALVNHPDVAGDQLHRLGRHRAAPSPRRRSRGWPRSSSRWAARTRWSCSTTPTCRRPSTARCRARTSRPASAARRRRGSSSPPASTTASSRR